MPVCVLSRFSHVLEGLMLKLKLQYFGHLMRRVDSLEKTLMLGGIGGRRRRGRQRMRWLDGITDSMDVSLSPGRLQSMGSRKSQTPDKELCLREALAVCTPPASEPSAKRPGS